MQFPLHVALRRSRLLSSLTVVLHLLAAVCVSLLPWPQAPRVLLLAIVAFSLWHALRPSPVVGLRLTEEGQMAFLSAAGERKSVSLLPDTVVFSHLIVLCGSDEGGHRLRTLALLPDSMSAEQFRLLRLWLRWRADPSGLLADDV